MHEFLSIYRAHFIHRRVWSPTWLCCSGHTRFFGEYFVNDCPIPDTLIHWHTYTPVNLKANLSKWNRKIVRKKIRDVQLFFYIPLIKLFVYVTVTKLGILNICKLHAITFFEQSPTLAKHMWKKLQIFKGKITNLDGEIIFAIGPAIFEIWAISTLHVLSITENKRKRDFHWNA